MEKKAYKFKLRKEMPKGFIQNKNYEELPAIIKFLKPYDGETFESPTEFEEILKGFLRYLKRKKVPKSSDQKLRKGLELEKLSEKFETEGWDYMVLTPASNGPGRCVFGGLEEIALD